MGRYYILNGKTPEVVENIFEWASKFHNTERVIAKKDISGSHISTVFLGFDHSFTDDDTPILFETMIFGGDFDGFQQRYHTWDEAKNAHDLICYKLQNGIKTL